MSCLECNARPLQFAEHATVIRANSFQYDLDGNLIPAGAYREILTVVLEPLGVDEPAPDFEESPAPLNPPLN